MKLPKFLRKIAGNDSTREEKRDARFAEIEAKGFKILNLSGVYEGKYAGRRYHVVTPSGERLTNDGLGYASSMEVQRAVHAYQKQHESN